MSERTLGAHGARIESLEKYVQSVARDQRGMRKEFGKKFEGMEAKLDKVLENQARQDGERKVIKWMAGSALTVASAVGVGFAKVKGWLS